MLNAMRRNAQSWIVKVLLTLLILSFAVWGVGDYLTRQANEPVVTINNVAIGPQQFAQAYEKDLERLRTITGRAIDKQTAAMLGLKQQTLSALVGEALLMEAAREMRLTVPRAFLQKRIANTPDFQTNGTFDPQRYDTLLRNNRLSPREYENGLARDLIQGQLTQAISQVAALPELLLADNYRMDREQRAVALLTLDPSALEAEVPVTDASLTAFLQENPNAFMTPTRVKVRYVLLNNDSVRDEIEVSEAEQAAYYEEHIAQYRQDETRQVRHILARIDAGNDEAAAQARITQAQQRLAAGESFEAVAKALSQDLTANSGGSLGSFGRGVMVPEFDQAAFSLPVGAVSQPVRTPFGIHLIQVTAITPATVQPLDAVREEIIARVKERKAVDAVYARSVVLEDQLYASGDLPAIARDLNLRYKELDFFSQGDDNLDALERHPKFLDAAFTTAKGEISPLVDLDDGRFFALEVVDRQEPRAQTLDEAREALTAAYRSREAHTKARSVMNEALQRLQSGTPWEEVAASHPALQARTTEPFVHSARQPAEPIRQAAFSLLLAEPLYPQVVETPEGFSLVRLTAITPPPAEGLAQAREQLEGNLTGILGRELMNAFMAELQSQAKIMVNQEMLNRF